MRWEVSVCTAAVLSGASSRSYSNQHVAFLCSSYLAFFSRRCVGVQGVHPYNGTDSYSLENLTFLLCISLETITVQHLVTQ